VTLATQGLKLLRKAASKKVKISVMLSFFLDKSRPYEKENNKTARGMVR